jgi:DNA (cytosine-5)-methyltransferase 1
MADRLTYASLFSGCGGFDLGMRQNKFECIAAYDINKVAVDVYNKNIRHVATERDLLLDFNEDKLNPSVVISGAPCQGFSTAGKRNIDDARNHLFLRAVEIALKLKPKVYVAENVAGILSGSHKEYFMDKAINILCNNGYKTHLFRIDCRSLGMGQM